MNNPNGPYPGRQLFLGITIDGKPCMAYLVTGRSPESRERKAVPVENTVRIGPTGNAPYDPLRHYSAVKYDNNTCVLAVTNGIQTEAIFETYKLLVEVGSVAGKDYLEKVMEGAGSEADSLHTPRISGVIVPSEDKTAMKFILGMKGYQKPARVHQIEPVPGRLTGISTYTGDMENPQARDPDSPLPELKCQSKTAKELAEFFFDISAASRNGNDIRVCTIGGIRSGNGKWELAIKNIQ